jgi:hypothetical protein
MYLIVTDPRATRDRRYERNVFTMKNGDPIDPLNPSGDGNELNIFVAMSLALLHLPKVEKATTTFKASEKALAMMRRQFSLNGDCYSRTLFVDGDVPTFRGVRIELVPMGLG